jgi:hypothetical protein
MAQERLAGIWARQPSLAGSPALGFARRLHDRLDLLHVVNIKCWQTIAHFRGVIEELTH